MRTGLLLLFYENNGCLFPFSLPSGVTHLLCLNGKQRYIPGPNTSKFFKRRFSSLELCIGFYLCTFLSGLEVFFPPLHHGWGRSILGPRGRRGNPWSLREELLFCWLRRLGPTTRWLLAGEKLRSG